MPFAEELAPLLPRRLEDEGRRMPHTVDEHSDPSRPYAELGYNIAGLAEADLAARPTAVQEFHHLALPRWLVLAGIPAVVPSTVELLLERIKLISYLDFNREALKIQKALNLSMRELLERYFLGYGARVCFVRNGAFSRRIFKAKTPKDSMAIYEELAALREAKKVS